MWPPFVSRILLFFVPSFAYYFEILQYNINNNFQIPPITLFTGTNQYSTRAVSKNCINTGIHVFLRRPAVRQPPIYIAQISLHPHLKNTSLQPKGL